MAKQLNYLGVDIGASGIKLVEFQNDNGRARLKTYGYSEYKSEKIADILEQPEEKGRELSALLKEAGAQSKRAVTGLPMHSVFTTLFTFGPTPEKELEGKIKNKIEKLAPMPKDDLVLDWKKVQMSSAEQNEIKVSVTAASKKMINKYVSVFKTAGLALSSLETESFALIRSLLGKDKGTSIVIDIGALKTNLLVVKETVPLIHRSIKAGGETITKFLSESMKVPQEKAEKIKRDIGPAQKQSADKLLGQIIESIVNEVKYSQNIFSEQYNKANIEKIVLTGGSSLLLGVAEKLSQATGLRVFVGDPWARVIYPEELRPTLDMIGPRFSVAIGLALRDILQ